MGTKKGKVTLPGLHEPPVLTDTGRRLANMYSTPSRCADGKTKKTALFTVWGDGFQTQGALKQINQFLGDFEKVKKVLWNNAITQKMLKCFVHIISVSSFS